MNSPFKYNPYACYFAIIASCLLFISELNAQNQSPNIILIMTDDQGWGDTGYNGHPHLKTPNLDAMVSNGVEFTRFYAASAVCSPTRGSVITGRHPLRYGICYANCGHILPEEITLAEMVKEVGYTTGHFGKWHLGTLTETELDANRGGRPNQIKHYSPPWENGFDECFVTESKVPTWDPMVTPPFQSGGVIKSQVEGEYYGTAYWTGPGEKVTENLEGDDSRVIMDRVIPFIDQSVEKGKPFLSVVWFHTPHLPVLTGQKYRNMYSHLSEDEQHYYGCITAMDEQVGRLRNHLIDLGIEKNTVLFFTSDNGPEGKNSHVGRTRGSTNGLRGRKRSLHEGGIRVPGIMEWPGHVSPGTTVEDPCFTSDYFPTIAHIIGVDIGKYNRPYDGQNLLEVINGQATERYLAFRIENQAALIGNQYKIYSDDNGQTFSMYDLINDPDEDEDLSPKKANIKANLVSRWKSWSISLENSAKGEDY